MPRGSLFGRTIPVDVFAERILVGESVIGQQAIGEQLAVDVFPGQQTGLDGRFRVPGAQVVTSKVHTVRGAHQHGLQLVAAGDAGEKTMKDEPGARSPASMERTRLDMLKAMLKERCGVQ